MQNLVAVSFRTGRTPASWSQALSTWGASPGRSVGAVRAFYRFDETCQRTVPEALIAFFDSTG